MGYRCGCGGGLFDSIGVSGIAPSDTRSSRCCDFIAAHGLADYCLCVLMKPPNHALQRTPRRALGLFDNVWPAPRPAGAEPLSLGRQESLCAQKIETTSSNN